MPLSEHLLKVPVSIQSAFLVLSSILRDTFCSKTGVPLGNPGANSRKEKQQPVKKHLCRGFHNTAHRSLLQTIYPGWHCPQRPTTADLAYIHKSHRTLPWEQNAKTIFTSSTWIWLFIEATVPSLQYHTGFFPISESLKGCLLSGDGCYQKQQISSGFVSRDEETGAE